jgi:TPR repeat protein
MKKCPKCGTDNSAAVKFCGECGTKLPAESPAADGAGIYIGAEAMVAGDVIGRKETITGQTVNIYHQHAETPKSAPRDENCILKIVADMDCRVFVDGRHVVDLGEESVYPLPLPRGLYQLKFVGIECPDDVRSFKLKLTDLGEFLETDLKPLRDARLKKAREERERQERLEREAQEKRQREEREAREAQEKRKLEEQMARRKQEMLAKQQEREKQEREARERREREERERRELAERLKRERDRSEREEREKREIEERAKREREEREQRYRTADINDLSDQELTEAVPYLQYLAKRNYPSAQNRLAMCYFLGKGIAKDYAEAAKWWRAAAIRENAEAQYNLGLCHYLGQCGMTQDYAKGMALYRQAAANGHDDAKALLEISSDDGLKRKTIQGRSIIEDFSKGRDAYVNEWTRNKNSAAYRALMAMNLSTEPREFKFY